MPPKPFRDSAKKMSADNTANNNKKRNEEMAFSLKAKWQCTEKRQRNRNKKQIINTSNQSKCFQMLLKAHLMFFQRYMRLCCSNLCLAEEGFMGKKRAQYHVYYFLKLGKMGQQDWKHYCASSKQPRREGERERERERKVFDVKQEQSERQCLSSVCAWTHHKGRRQRRPW